eukprot:m.42811 g.42811  ORF g.42811 m.42811 type:complete len:729 (-) comp7078_c0_seq2:104-2290(-)
MSQSFPPTQHDVVLLFGSETGTAEEICRDISKNMQQAGIDCECYEMNKAKTLMDLRNEKIVILISSTTGEGEPPENALKFWKMLNQATKETLDLSKQRFAVLGLGSSDYDNFCAMGKNFYKKMLDLGGQCFMEPGFADDATGLEAVVEPWAERIISAVEKILPEVQKDWKSSADGESKESKESKEDDESRKIKENDKETSEIPSISIPLRDATHRDLLISLGDDLNVDKLRLPRTGVTSMTVEFGDEEQSRGVVEDVNTWFAAELIAYRCLTARNAVKRTLECRFKLPAHTDFRPGDSFAMSCPNIREEVERMIKVMKLTDVKDKPLHFIMLPSKKNKAPTIPHHLKPYHTLSEVLTVGLDIRAIPKKKLLRVLGDSAKDEDERKTLLFLSSSFGARDYDRAIRNPKMNLVDILEKFPSSTLTLGQLFDLLPPLQPRSYSACSPNEDNTVSFVFNIVGTDTPDEEKSTGVCTSYLESLCLNLYNIAAQSILSDVEQLRKAEKRNEWYAIDPEPLELTRLILSPHLPRHIHCTLRKTVGTVLSKLSVPIFRREIASFRPPTDPTVPLIVIGPGTGIAPFYAFAKERLLIKRAVEAGTYKLPDTAVGNTVGPLFVFFGCRNELRDFIFREEWEEMLAQKAVSWMFTAFSRDEGSDHKYVQSHITQQAPVIHNLMAKHRAMIFICGSVHILQPLYNALDQGIAESRNISVAEAKQIRDAWQKDGRIRSELW